MRVRTLIVALLLALVFQCSPMHAQRIAMNYQGAYAAGTTYQKGDSVASGSAVYVSIVSNNYGNTPASSPSDWQPLGGSGGCTSGCTFASSTYNGVNLQTGGSTTAFLNQAGGYGSASGASVSIKFLSVEGCPQNSDGNAGGGTDGTACINSLFAAASPTNPVTVWQDQGFTLIGTGGTGIQCPAAGNCTLTGNGGGIARTYITNCSISGGVAILTTKPNTLTAGQRGTLADLSNCSSITNTTVVVLSSGLTSTQFEVAASGTVTSGAENATFNQVWGTGFFLASGANVDAIANGHFASSGNCVIPAAAPQSQGANIHLSNFVINGNANGQSAYCFGAHFANLNNFSSVGVVYYNAAHYSLTLDNASDWVVEGNTFFSSSPPIGTTTDGVHVDGPSIGGRIFGNYFKTGDDAIALNSPEGYCGPITSMQISDNTFDNSFTAMRMYNENQNTCGNGLVPLISYIDWTNNSGTVSTHPFIFGLGSPPYETGTLNPAIAHVHISNSTFNNPAPGGGINYPFYLSDNIDDISISNFTIVSPQLPNNTIILFGPGNCGAGNDFVGRVAIDNLNVVNTAAGSGFDQLFGDSGCSTVGSVTMHGFGTTWEGASPTTQGPLINGMQSGSTLGYLSMVDVDPTHLTIIGSLAGISQTSALVPNGYVDSGATASNLSPLTVVTSSSSFSTAYKGNETLMVRAGSSPVILTLPPMLPGLTKCAQNYLNDTGTIELLANGSDYIWDMAGNQSSSGGYIISSGALGDSICVQGVSNAGGNNWQMTSVHGTWMVH